MIIYQIRIYIALCVFALIFILSYETASAQNMLLNGEQQWLKINAEAVDTVEIIICEDENCVYEIDRFSSALCTSPQWVCNLPTPDNHYVLTCTAHTCVLNRGHKDSPFFKLIVRGNGKTLTSDVQPIGKTKMVEIESGRLILSESRIDFDKLRSPPRRSGEQQGSNRYYQWFLIFLCLIIEVLMLFVLFWFWRQRTNSGEWPRTKFWIVFILIQPLLFFAYSILFDASQPFILVRDRVSMLLGFVPPVVVYLFLTVWFYHSTMPTWSRKVPIALVVTLVVFACVLAFLLWLGLSMWTYGNSVYALRGFSVTAALRLVYLVCSIVRGISLLGD